MEMEKFERANELKSQVAILEEKIKKFNPENKWVHLQISDHYGNKGHIIETYAFDQSYLDAFGRNSDDFVAKAYSTFLETVRDEMQKRIDYLQSEFNKL